MKRRREEDDDPKPSSDIPEAKGPQIVLPSLINPPLSIESSTRELRETFNAPASHIPRIPSWEYPTQASVSCSTNSSPSGSSSSKSLSLPSLFDVPITPWRPSIYDLAKSPRRPRDVSSPYGYAAAWHQRKETSRLLRRISRGAMTGVDMVGTLLTEYGSAALADYGTDRREDITDDLGGDEELQFPQGQSELFKTCDAANEGVNNPS